ncbi:MAG: monovalent cation:proton antiporter-2 (CPA2) family protein [Gammaproteobacteria bacterium]|nr:monovalent cation:proton antiporter-2 (CPA2) family protein [Gammaproteobacteria bacterium]
MEFLEETAIFLGTAVIAVPLFRRLGFGSVLGYLAAGVVIGPWALGLISDSENILRFAELGVVFLLFLVGLELRPHRLWVLRKQVFGLGMAQVIVTGVVLTGFGLLLGLAPNVAWLAGFGLALSSTAFVLQMLAEKNQLTTTHGRWAFSVLLFQDLAVIPLLALVAFLGTATIEADGGTSGRVVISVLVTVAVFAGGRFVLRHVFRAVARWGTAETFTAAALLVVIGAALLMESAHVSMGLGAFLAGMLLADSEYRHQLEADIAPFKGLLLGLFFIAVGMTANIALLAERWPSIVGVMFSLLLVKAIIIFVLGRIFGLSKARAGTLSMVLPQGGEFAFVLFAAAMSYQLISQTDAEFFILVVTLSMAATPLLFIFDEKILRRWLGGDETRHFDTISEEQNFVIIAGFGRVGQVIGRILAMRRIRFTAIDSSVDQVDIVRRFGNKVYYGEPHRLDILRAAKVEACTIIVVAIGDPEESLKTVQTIRTHYPLVRVYARARNRYHALRLMDLGVEFFLRDTLLSSLALSEAVLQGLGDTESQAAESVKMFEEFDRTLLKRQQAVQHDESKFIQSAKEASEELRELFEQQAAETIQLESASKTGS